MKIVVATHNKGKIREFKAALAEIGIEAVGIGELVTVPEPVEDGDTFAANALLKARYIFDKYGVDCFADDTGLEVKALNGEPGVYSARYAGEHATDEDNNKKLLNALKDVPADKRTGRYVAELVLAYPDGKELTARGTCEGVIIDEAHGEGGFGYDPYFYVPSLGHTMAEIPLAEKNAISHRGLALKKLVALLKDQ